jgi:hypothetical protein
VDKTFWISALALAFIANPERHLECKRQDQVGADDPVASRTGTGFPAPSIKRDLHTSLCELECGPTPNAPAPMTLLRSEAGCNAGGSMIEATPVTAEVFKTRRELFLPIMTFAWSDAFVWRF